MMHRSNQNGRELLSTSVVNHDIGNISNSFTPEKQN